MNQYSLARSPGWWSGRSKDMALQTFRNDFKGTNWIVLGNINKFFDTMNHGVPKMRVCCVNRGPKTRVRCLIKGCKIRVFCLSTGPKTRVGYLIRGSKMRLSLMNKVHLFSEIFGSPPNTPIAKNLSHHRGKFSKGRFHIWGTSILLSHLEVYEGVS